MACGRSRRCPRSLRRRRGIRLQRCAALAAELELRRVVTAAPGAAIVQRRATVAAEPRGLRIFVKAARAAHVPPTCKRRLQFPWQRPFAIRYVLALRLSRDCILSLSRLTYTPKGTVLARFQAGATIFPLGMCRADKALLCWPPPYLFPFPGQGGPGGGEGAGAVKTIQGVKQDGNQVRGLRQQVQTH